MTVDYVNGSNANPNDSIVLVAPPLTENEKQTFVSYLMSHMNMSQEMAMQLLSNATPEQVRSFLAQATGPNALNRESAKQLAMQTWGLTEEQAEAMFGTLDGPNGSFTNPFGDAFLQLLILCNSFQIDIRQLMNTVIGSQLQLAINAAREKKQGAFNQFMFAMSSAAVTAGLGVLGGLQATRLLPERFIPKDGHNNQWLGPIGASLLTAPLNSTGEYMNQLEQYQAALIEADRDEGDKRYQQLVNELESYINLIRNLEEGLGR